MSEPLEQRLTVDDRVVRERPARQRVHYEGAVDLPELRRPAERARSTPIRSIPDWSDVEVPLPTGDGAVVPTPDADDRGPVTDDAPLVPSNTSVTGEGVPFPIVAQRRAVAALRGHVVRDVARAATLIAGDIALVSILQVTFRAVRTSALLGSSVADFFRVLLPPGTLFPRQLLIALAGGFLVTGVYTTRDRSRAIGRLLLGTAVAFALIFWDQAWHHPGLARSAAVLGAFIVVGGALVLERWGMAHLLPLFPSVAPARARALIIGTADDGRTLRERVVAEDLEFDLVGYVRVDGFDDPGSLGIVSDLTRVIAGQRIDTVIICGEHATGASAAQLVWTAEEAGCQVLLMPSPVLADFDPAIAWSGGMPLVQLTRPTLRGGQLVVKRAGDIVLSLALLIGVAPIGFLVALAVRLSSRGPIFFRQIRVGVGGRHFAMYKFRSMVLDAESRRAELMQQSVYEDGRLFKVVDDPRITTVGKWLRRTSLDELPQLWNVLRGDMSLVGPRPPLPSEVALYEEHHYSRFYMKPGMTGPWQVSGRNRVTDFKQVVGIETAYMRQWRLTRDLSILCRTIPAVFRSVGAS